MNDVNYTKKILRCSNFNIYGVSKPWGYNFYYCISLQVHLLRILHCIHNSFIAFECKFHLKIVNICDRTHTVKIKQYII
jgi:hypothetical protein